mmetsp:Transcript_49952/g.156360  ORF Transcript_49952/g.156360 Transcript_49952/m.156360 type:complete len:91 (+) Transcript_49952:4009-4281(+)
MSEGSRRDWTWLRETSKIIACKELRTPLYQHLPDNGPTVAMSVLILDPLVAFSSLLCCNVMYTCSHGCQERHQITASIINLSGNVPHSFP